MTKPDAKYRKRDIDGHELSPESLMMSYGYDPMLSQGAVKCPIFQTSTFVFESAEDGKSFFELAYGKREREPTEEPGLIYSRINNPDLEILEDRLTLWDDAESGLVFASGMASIATTLLTFLRPGDRIVHSTPVYGGTEFLLYNILPQFGVDPLGFSAHRPESLEEVAASHQNDGSIGVIYVETPANPTNDLIDIRRCARLADRLEEQSGRRPLIFVDNTFLGPLWQHPLEHGADLAIYSLTKYVGGHSDIIAGACLGSEEVLSAVRGMRTILGTMPDPNTGWLLMRSLETLKVRMEKQRENAREVAEFLSDHERVEQVHYLGFLDEDNPQHAVYERQCGAPGATFSFEVDGGEAESFEVLNSLQLIKLAVSLGGTESLAQHPATMTHSDIEPEKQREMGITSGMIRLSVGIESADDLIQDLDQALNGI